ncbi:MAG: hypothetical protein ACXAEX_13855 [Promethearchaeota archaeon]|jgi:hypothetical protein
MLPPKESVFTVDTTGDGKADSIQIKVINLLLPFTVPENIEIGDFKLGSFDFNNINLSEYFSVFLDDRPLNLSKESLNVDTIKDYFSLFHKGESFNFDDILEGKLSGRTINLGDSVSILITLNPDTLSELTKGPHAVKIDSDFISNLIINFELDENNMNLKFDPKNT